MCFSHVIAIVYIQNLAGRRIPDLDSLISRTRGDVFAIRGPCDGCYSFGMFKESQQTLTGCSIPDLDGFISGARGDRLAVRRPGCYCDSIGMLAIILREGAS